MAMGRPPKPLTQLMRQGTARADRHGDRIDTLWDGEPSPAKFSCPHAQWMWDQIVNGTPDDVLKTVDSAALMAIASYWSVFKTNIDLILSGDGQWTTHCKANSAFKSWQSLAGQFGLTPVARTKIKRDAGAMAMLTNADPMGELVATREG